jgi:hypothetical protein
MVDLAFASPKARARFECGKCCEQFKEKRKCQSNNFNVDMKPIHIDDWSLSYSFCPAVVYQHLDIQKLFLECRIAMKTGILPRAGNLENQDPNFQIALYAFIDRWESRTYAMVWRDVSEFTKEILGAIFGKKIRRRGD